MDIAMTALRPERLSSTAFSFDTAFAKFGQRGSAPGKIVSQPPMSSGISRSPRSTPLEGDKVVVRTGGLEPPRAMPDGFSYPLRFSPPPATLIG